MRDLDLKKPPSVSETIDWARVLVLLHAHSLTQDLVRETMNVFSKFEEDVEVIHEHLHELTRKTLHEARF